MTPKHVVTFYEMTESEVMSANILPEPTLRLIENLHATDVMSLINLEPDPNNYAAYIQKHAELSGAIAAWRALIDAHKDTVKMLAVQS